MSLHDAYARRTPFELAFPDPVASADLFARIDEEASGRGLDPTELQSFLALSAVGEALRELRGPDVGGEAIHRYAVLAQQSYLFAKGGAPLWLLSTESARRVVGGAETGEPGLPGSSGYLQLPQHLFWVEGPEVPESVDGIAWRLDPLGTLHLLLAGGIRPDRPGFTVVPVAEAPWADAAGWVDARVRAEGEGADFAAELPGAELEGLYGVRTAGEALKLLVRFCLLLKGAPERVELREPAAAEPGAVPPSRFPYRRVR